MRLNNGFILTRHALTRLLILLVLAMAASFHPVIGFQTDTAYAAASEDFLVVDCLLPGKMRKLGKKVSFVTARKALRTSQSDCELRGGEYTSYDRADYSTSLQIWLPLAQEGDVKAQNYVGEIYEKGVGGAPQYKQAAEWYLKAAEAGLSAAQVNLGALYERGLGVEASKEKAAFWYRKASGLDTANVEFIPGLRDEEVKQLRQQKDAAESDRNSLRREFEKLRRQLDDTQRQLKNQSKKSSSLSDELQKTKQQQASAPAPAASNEARSLALAAELEAQRANEAKLKAAIASLEKQSSELVSQLEASTSSKDQQLAATHEEMTKLRQALEAQQETAQAEKERVQELAGALAAREAAHRAELALAKQESAALQTGRSEIENKMAAEKAALEAELAAARKLAESSSARSSEMEKNLARMEQKLQAMAKQEAAPEPQAAPVTLAQAGPEIAIIDPPLVVTRNTKDPIAPINSADAQLVVGKVTSAATLMMLKVNGTEVPVDKNAMFRVSVPVRNKETAVNVVAIDETGGRRTLTFNLVKGGALAPVTAVASENGEIDPKQLNVKFGEYHALVIGNSKYQFLPALKTAKNDAEVVSRLLKEKYGFKVTTLLDASRYDILSTLNKLREELTEDQNLLIYYAGHGDLDRVNQRGNWLPVDAEPDSTANWISNIQITDVLNAMTARQIMLVVDSCYSGTLTRSSLARLDSGMSPAVRGKWIQKMAEKRSRVVLTSGGVAPVLDGGGGGHSVFARAFLNALEANQGVLEGQKLFQVVTAEVASSSATADFEQVPQYAPIKYAGHESGDFFLVSVAPRLN